MGYGLQDDGQRGHLDGRNGQSAIRQGHRAGTPPMLCVLFTAATFRLVWLATLGLPVLASRTAADTFRHIVYCYRNRTCCCTSDGASL